ncbi:hypothetical protein [Cellvibrio sp. PSBB006]|uniref:hypothetical protein n=1 Tax=Cellvibrio sp. PSBB006 TaxID=1987723 RepID=UPI000B3B995A|nr:hypothetical protein [Cellvibrio sp. PSBB006]ARU27756.1 hypothetical protein CBR65_10135 [Cellvibrio sp. PSBB006]
MNTIPKPIHLKNRKGFLIKNLAHIPNGIGQTLQVFYPVFCNTAHRICFLIHRLTNQATPHAALGYFILSMSSFTAPYIALMDAQ